MDYDKLIETLRQHGVSCVRAYGKYCSICDEAATALSTLQAENNGLKEKLYDGEGVNLVDYWMQQAKIEENGHRNCQAENEKLRAELERVTAEMDAAVKDLNEFLAMDELCPIQCEWCKWKDTFCDGKTPEWRGQKED